MALAPIARKRTDAHMITIPCYCVLARRVEPGLRQSSREKEYVSERSP